MIFAVAAVFGLHTFADMEVGQLGYTVGQEIVVAHAQVVHHALLRSVKGPRAVVVDHHVVHQAIEPVAERRPRVPVPLPEFARLACRTTTRDEETRAMNAMRAELSGMPGVQYEFRRPALMSFAAPLQIEVAGFDLDR